jgi:hypothetical protein
MDEGREGLGLGGGGVMTGSGSREGAIIERMMMSSPPPTPLLSSSSSSGSAPTLYLPEKTRALQQVLEQINKEFGECNEKIKQEIKKVTVLYTSNNQKILSNNFSVKEREHIYSLSKQNHMERYRNLYKQFLDLHRERSTFAHSVYEEDPSLKTVHEYLEGQQQALGSLLRKFNTILESGGN